MGSDESHFNVSLIVKDKVSGQCPQATTSEETGEHLKRQESRSGFEPRSLCLPAQRLTARPNWLTNLPNDDEVELHVLGCWLTY